jgi:deoxyadenosine/deoxycytidine kinase
VPIICLEGTSAVGKSTTCRAFADKYDAYVVEETHFLFGPTKLQGIDLVDWHLECQIKRWHIASEKSKEYENVLLDGDIFKLWYDWVYGLDNKVFDHESNFFRKKIISDELSFPHCYIVLWAEETDLRKRKESDKTRGRGGFEKHLKLVDPQIKYFKALNTVVPNYAGIYQAKTIEENVQNIRNQILKSPGISPDNTLHLFDFMIEYLGTASP